MDFFNTKKLAALEARIAALEPKAEEYKYAIDAAPALTLESVDKRLKKVEDEVMPEYGSGFGVMVYMRNLYWGGEEKLKKLTLHDKVERLCKHLKLEFVTEPQRHILKPVKKAK